ncbi:MAG: pantoate--beta-alanine ligase [Candidatus Krumholzibacteria bacterium]|nr:pantoate--beta-alanine ligase [Candidatus Krumholzibacteria bacterium]
MKTVTTPREARRAIDEIKKAGARVGLVPTMGALHEGHASLVRMARARTEFVVASIFVNPRQFGPKEDLSRYPRTLEADRRMLEDLGCDLLFHPNDADLYSPADRTRISVEGISDVLCGAARRDHFQGVALVVAKLFNIIGPDAAFFGQKDAQQALVIQRMAADLDIPVTILLGPTVREADGLAMSSRNRYLDPESRSKAPAMYAALASARRRIEAGERDPAPLAAMMTGTMRAAGFDVEYAGAVDGATLEPLERMAGTVLLACAGRIGGTRLIDNVTLRVSGAKVEEIVLEFPEWSRYV